MTTGIGRRSCIAAWLGAFVASLAFAPLPADAGVEHLRISDSSIYRTASRLGDELAYPQAYLGQTTDGAVFWGLACYDGSTQLWKIGKQREDDRKIEIAVRGLVALSRGAGAIWAAGRQGLYRVENGKAEQLSGIRALRYPGPRPTGPYAPFKLYSSERLYCISLAVDAREIPWVIHGGFTSVGTYWPVAKGQRENQIKWYVTCESVGARRGAVVAPDPVTGVWVYAPQIHKYAKYQKRLVHLELVGAGEDIEIVELTDSPPEPAIPVLNNPSITVGSAAGVLIAGETDGGNMLVRFYEGKVETIPIPDEIIKARRVTAVAVDTAGRAFFATDGAGVLMYDGSDWTVHEVTDHLPTLYETGLKPVDDVLVTDNGVLYVASQDRVIRWWPDEE